MCQDAPDYGPLRDASVESARIMGDLGQQQIDFARQQYDELSPIIRGLAGTQQAAMEQQMGIAADNKAFMDEYVRPMQQGLIRDAEEFNTRAYRDRLANQAAADAGRAFSQTRAANERAARSMGVNPNSGAAQAANAQAGLGLAAARGGMMNNTRDRARDMGYARRMEAVNMGMGMGQQALSAYQGATGSGSAAAGTYMAPGNQYMAGLNMGAGTIGQGQNMMLGGLSNALNAEAQFAGQTNAGIGNAIGSIAGAVTMYGMGGGFGGGGGAPNSDRRVKENIKLVRKGKHGLNIYHFKYKGDPSGKTYEGVMADEVLNVMPNAVATDDMGFMSVDYDMLGIEMREVA